MGTFVHADKTQGDDNAVILVRFATELLEPTLVAPATLDQATSEQFPGLAGVVPGLGSYDPNPWGLGFELKDNKSPHWTAPEGSPRTFGNGGAPCQVAFMDPETGTSFAFLTNGYPLAGYDHTRLGENRVTNIGNLGNDLVG